MLADLLGSQAAEQVLLFLTARGEGYGREIADFWGVNLTGIQRQLDRLERCGVLVQRPVGRTRLYSWNPRWPFRKEFGALLRRAVDFLPEAQRAALEGHRRRPRRKGKPA